MHQFEAGIGITRGFKSDKANGEERGQGAGDEKVKTFCD